MGKSLKFYTDIIFWTNYAFYLVYLVIKIVAAVLLYLLERANKDQDSCVSPVAKTTKPMRWLVLHLFGGPLGILERNDDYQDETDENDIPMLYIRKKRLSYGTIMILCMLFVAFVILALSSATNIALLRTTHICSEDPQINCYPQLTADANDSIIELYNITIDTSQPIEDCSFFNSEVVSTQVTFDCYQFVYNVELFVAVVGGLLTFFNTTMKFATGFLLWVNECCSCCVGCCTTTKKVFRFILVGLAGVTEIILAIVCMVFGLMEGVLADAESDSPILRFLAMHVVEILIGCGIIATLLCLPWERYVDEDEEDDENYIM